MNFIKKNGLFFLLLLLFFVVSVVLLLSSEKGTEVHWLNQHRSPALNYFFIYITKIAETYGIIFFFVCYLAINRRLLGFTAVNMLIVLIVVQTLKRAVFADMLRPSVLLPHLSRIEGVEILSNYSFPSGHTATAFSLLVMPLFFYSEKKWLQVSVFLLALLIGISRIYLGHHFLQDVVAGAATGVAITTLCYYGLTKVLPAEKK